MSCAIAQAEAVAGYDAEAEKAVQVITDQILAQIVAIGRTVKSLDAKLAEIKADRASRAFIIADARRGHGVRRARRAAWVSHTWSATRALPLEV